MKKTLLIIFLLFLVSCSNHLQLNTPMLSFVDTTMANLSSTKGKIRYVMRYELTEESINNLYAKIHYQDLRNKNVYHTSFIGALSNVKVINYNSIADTQIINKHYFEITLMLYKDANYTEIIGIHRNLLWFDMPETVAEILKITLL